MVDDRPVPELAVATETGDRAIDQRGPVLAQLFGTESQALDHAGPVALDHHIAGLRDALREGEFARVLEIELDAVFAHVDGDRGRRVPRIWLRAFRIQSPPGGSTLITSAPCAAISMVA